MKYAFIMVLAYALVVLTIFRFEIEVKGSELAVVAIIAGFLHIALSIPGEIALLGVLIGYVAVKESISDIFGEQ